LFRFLHYTQLNTHTLTLSLSHTLTHTLTLSLPHSHTLPPGFSSKTDQLVAESATNATHNKYTRQTSMPLVGFEPAILPISRPKTYALDRTATGIGYKAFTNIY
jgi:hypothetical protein